MILGGAELLSVYGGEFLEDVVGQVSSFGVGPEIGGVEASQVRVDQNLETLEETVGLLRLFQGIRDVLGERARLDPAENRNAQGRHVYGASPYPIDLEGAVRSEEHTLNSSHA